jgi:hypothetical protein
VDVSGHSLHKDGGYDGAGDDDEMMDLELANRQKRIARESGELRVQFKRYPITMWIVGILLILIGSYLFYHLWFGHHGGVIIQSFTERHWWQYLIASLIVLMGILFFANGSIEILTIDKEVNLISIAKKKCCCCTRTQAYDLKNVRNVRSFKKGHEGINHYTLHYTL